MVNTRENVLNEHIEEQDKEKSIKETLNQKDLLSKKDLHSNDDKNDTLLKENSNSENPYLIEFIENEKHEIEQQFLALIGKYYIEDIDVQQTISITSSKIIDKLDKLQRKLLLLSKSGVSLSPYIYNKMAFYFLIREFYNDGLELLVDNLEDVDKLDVAYNFIGLFYYRLGHLDLSTEAFQKNVEIKSSLSSSKYSLGIILYLNDKFEESLEYLLTEEKKYSCRINFLLCVGNCYYNLNQKEKSLLYYEKYLEKSNKNKKVIERTANIAYDIKDFDKALLNFLRMKELNIPLNGHEFKLAVIYYYKENINQAVYYLVELLNFDRNLVPKVDKDFLFGLFLQSFELKLYDYNVFNIIDEMLEDDDDDKRIELLKRKSALLNRISEDDDDDIILFRARINMLINEYEEAEKCFHILLEKGFSDKNILQDLCKVYFNVNKKKEGMEIFNNLADKDTLDAETYYHIAETYFEEENFDDAIKYFAKAIEKGFDNTKIYNLLAYCNFMKNNYDEAINCYKVLIEKNPENLDTYNDLGIVYSEKQDYKEALNQFKYVLSKNPKHKEAHYNISKTYKLIIEEEANKHYEEYLNLSDDDPDSEDSSFSSDTEESNYNENELDDNDISEDSDTEDSDTEDNISLEEKEEDL